MTGRKCLVLLLLLTATFKCHGQDSLLIPGHYPGINQEENVLQNRSYLEPFFEKLHNVKNGSDQVINIVHIGDSHIQADYMTEVVRKNLQLHFGNGGRGLIVPGRVAGTNEPGNFKSYSTYAWNSKRLIHTTKPLSIGVGGITLHTDNPAANFTINMSDPSHDYRFNAVSFFFLHNKASFSLSVRDSAANELGRVITDASGTTRDYYGLMLPSLRNHLQVQVVRENSDQHHATLFGMNLENGKPGVRYHAIGVNGAKYEHYNSADLFAQQTALLQPDLFIISLGTNEAMDYPHIHAGLSASIAKLIESLSRNNPEARFILVTPPDAFIRKVRVNPGIGVVRDQVLSYAVENGTAFWDMYKVNGGKNSAAEWKAKGMLRPDGVHFTKEGYAFQGSLLFLAIMKGYYDYVADRHP